MVYIWVSDFVEGDRSGSMERGEREREFMMNCNLSLDLREQTMGVWLAVSEG